MADTAALIANLDGVIAVDTAVAPPATTHPRRLGQAGGAA